MLGRTKEQLDMSVRGSYSRGEKITPRKIDGVKIEKALKDKILEHEKTKIN